MKTYEDFSLKNPSLTHYLSRILKRYPLGGQIIKELIQNAEDSGASVAKFYIDYSEYPKETLLHPGLDKFQGPALLAYNNSIFDDSDFQSIRNIEKSEKYDKPLKIGKFGLGFNSIYHLTDLPTIISRNSLIIFDPHQRYFNEYGCKRGIRILFDNSGSKSELISKYPDQFKPYTNINFSDADKFDQNFKIDFNNEFKGTFFRFPIRNEEAAKSSELSNTHKPLDKILADVLESFFKDFNLILLFLRRLERIEFYEIKDGAQKLIASTFIDYSKSSEGLKCTRNEFMIELNKRVNQNEKTMKANAFDFDDIINNYKMVIETSILDKATGLMSNKIEKYLLSSFVKFKSSSDALRQLAHKTATFPMSGVAYKITQIPDLKDKFKQSRYFCFLPMPETIELSGLPLHINGSFGLRDDRRDFKWLAEDAKDDETAIWQELIVSEVLSKVLIQIIDYSKRLIESKDSDLSLQEFYHLLPCLENMSHNWKNKHLKTYLNSLSRVDLILTRSKNWCKVKDAYLNNKLVEQITKYSDENHLDNQKVNYIDSIYKLIDDENLSLISVPQHLIDIFRLDQQAQLKFIDLQAVCMSLKNKQNVSKLDDKEKANLLNFIIQWSDDKLINLKDTHLLPLTSGDWIQFNNSQNEIIIFNDNEIEDLFSAHLNSIIFDLKRLNKISRKKVMEWLEQRIESNENLEQLVLYRNEKFFKLFEMSLNKLEINQKRRIHSDNLEWLELVWKYITKNFSESLEPFEKFHIIPNEQPEFVVDRHIETFPLREDASSKVNHFLLNNSKSEIPSKIIEFFKANAVFRDRVTNKPYGCIIFDELPFDLFKNHNIHQYFRFFDLDSLMESFTLLKECSGDNFQQLLCNNMSPECKIELVTYLNKEAASLTSKKNFIQLIRNEFPIFMFHRKPVQSIASNNQQIPEIIIQDGIEIDPSIVALDCSLCKSLASVLGFTTWELNQIVDKTFDFYISNNDFTSIHGLIKWIIENRNRISKFEAINIQNLLLNKRVFSDQTNNVLANLNELYDPTDKYVKILVDKANILSNLYETEPFYSFLKPHLLKSEKIDLKFFDKYMTELEATLESFESYDEAKRSEIINKIKTILEFIFEMNNLKNTDLFLKASFKYKWIPSRQSSSIHTFYRSNELYWPDNSDLIGLVRPIVDKTVVPEDYFNSLKVKTEISPSEVFENYSYMVENVKDIDSKVLEKIYSFIKDNNSEVFDIEKSINETFSSRNIPFVFDGIDSYRHPKELIMIPSSIIGDLSPYYFVIDEKNTFVNKFKAFYTEKLGIVPELDLNILLDVLDRIREDTTPSNSKKNNLIEQIYSLLNKSYVNELTANKSMRNRLWLPVMVDSNLGFEKIEKCVYDDTEDYDDDELKNEKIEICAKEGIRICYAEINSKFLKKLGVKSFTDRIMSIEEIEIENFGQSEKLTDRINKLLAGYKDGLSVFKEIIQNADDANANVVKFCYDKRKNIWKNPKKLLDPGMVNAQSPALIVYNDSKFTDSDFKNLSQLGSGSKKNEKDKIGKFGLGFNTVYNLTDIPSIVSGNTYVAFDPEIKYLKNRIKDPSNPGIKFCFKESTNQYLKKYSDQFKPFENVFGCNIFDKDFNYDGTLIKLPLRTTPSAISSNVYNSDYEIMRLFEILHKNGDSLLLFTQNVKKIEIFFLDDGSNEMKLLFEVEKSPIKYLKKHQVNIDERIQNYIKLNETELEYKKQINILKAIEVGLRSSSNLKIETSFLLKTSIKVCKNNFQLISPENEFKESKESKWLIVSSFNSDDLVRNDESFNNFVPCVGMAVEIEQLSNSFHNKMFKLKQKEVLNIGMAFCFLPLDIKTSLNYHINASFLLTEDRLNFYQCSTNDKTNNNKHEWNKRLLKPLVNNLIILINHVSECCYIEDIHQIIEYFWPIDNKSPYFIDFEKEFYQEMFKPGQLTFPYIQDAQHNKISFKQYDQCILVDFDFDNKDAQTEAIKVAKKVLEKNDKLELIELSLAYLNKIKSYIKQERLVNDLNLLEKLLAERSFLQDNECYEKLLIFYINEKLFVNKKLTKYGEFIQAGDYILTSGKQFKSLSNLVNPNQDKFFKEMIESSDNFFPSDAICNDDRCLFQLSELGLQKYLTSEMIIALAEKVNSTAKFDLNKSKSLSKTLNEYLCNIYDKLDADLINELKVRLNNISWLFPKEKPYAWSLPWFTETNKSASPTYKPTELIDNKYTSELGCLKPLACSFQTQNLFLTFLDVDTLFLIDNSINQLNLIIHYFKSNNNSKNEDSEKNLREFIEKIYSLMNQYLNPIDLPLDQFAKSKRLDELKSKLPAKWIFNPDCKQHMFLGIESFALDVENAIEPELIKFPNLYTKYIDLFKHFGIGDYFTIDILRLKLEKLKNEFLDEPLDADHFKTCMKIIQEILYVDKIKKNSNTQTLVQMTKNEKFYLPDENNIMRDLKELTFENPNTLLNSDMNFYVLNSSVPAKSFGIEGLKNKLLSAIGEPFGQKEKLIDRIKDILNRYSTEICIFNELIQNADDANATEIKFVLDKRVLSKEKTFGESFNELQGPALCCWNNSIFQNADFEGIIGLGKGSKRDVIEKCGRFGVGFNSVYHLTDAPQFISNFQDYVIFDPLCKYFPDTSESNPGFRIRNIKKNLKESFYSDVLSGFDFGLDLEESTMFRFPLRSNCNSKISSNTFTTNKLGELIEMFTKRCEETLLFLKNIKKISFYSLDQTGLSLTSEHTIELSKEDQSKRDDYLKNLNIQMRNPNYISNMYQKLYYTANIKTNQKVTSSYLILEQFGVNTQKNDIKLDRIRKELGSKNNLKNFPVAALAYKINKSQDNYKFYNCLPLQQKSPLNCNINAYWCLHKENRTNIYEYNQREENVDKETAILSTDWNLNLINNIILPLYINLVKLIIQKYESGLINYENIDAFAEKYIKLFSYGIQEDTKALEPYFKEFYKRFCNALYSVNCLPYINSNNNLEWIKPSEVVLSSSLEKYLKDNQMNSFREILKILKKIGVKVLKKGYADVFKHGDVDLNEIEPIGVINAFKSKSIEFDGHFLEETVISNETNLRDILSFCFEIEYFNNLESFNISYSKLPSLIQNLESFPLLLTNDNKLRKFSTTDKILLYDNPEIFDDSEKQKLFINKNFYDLFNKLYNYKFLKNDNSAFFKSYLKYIDIHDLKDLLPSVLNIVIANNNNADSIKLENSHSTKIEIIWDIIKVAVESFHKNDTIISKQVMLAILDPIKDSYLIPVCYNSSNQVHLLQISQCKMIFWGASNSTYSLNDIFKDLDIPKLDPKFQTNHVLKRILFCCDRNGDVLEFLDGNKDNETIFKKENKGAFLNYINNCILLNYGDFGEKYYEFGNNSENPIDQYEIKQIIRYLPIFTDYFEYLDTLENKTVYLLNLNDLPNEVLIILRTAAFFQEDLIDFCNRTNSILIEYYQEYDRLYKYLDLNVIKLDDFYETFFNYCLSRPEANLRATFKDYVDVLRILDENNQLNNQKMIELLKTLPFISRDQKTFYGINQLLDGQNSLFEVCFPDSIIPNVNEFRSIKWKNFLIKFGLKTEINVEDCGKIATILAEKYSNNQIDLAQIESNIKELFKAIANKLNNNDKDDIKALNLIKSIKFIPNYYLSDHSTSSKIQNKIHYLINKEENKLISLENSTISKNEDYYWTIKPVLPNYCNILLDYNYDKCLNIYKDVNYDCLIDNLIKLIDTLSTDDLINKLNKKERNQIKQILAKNFHELQSLFSSSDHSILNRLKNKKFVLNKNINTKKYQFTGFELFYKDLVAFDAIDGHFHTIPRHFQSFFKLFKHCGAKERVNVSDCISLLNSYLELSNNNPDKKLTLQQYKNVMVIFKMLFYDNLVGKSQEFLIYAPSLFKTMERLENFYYPDKSSHDRLIGNSDYIKRMCLFNIKDMMAIIENPIKASNGSSDEESGDNEELNVEKNQSNLDDNEFNEGLNQNDSNFLKRLMLKQLNWNQIFMNIPYFTKYPRLKPRPLSEILVEKLDDSDGSLTEAKPFISRNNTIHSSVFIEAVVKSIYLINDELNKNDLNGVLTEKISNSIKSISVFIKDEIKTYFININTNERIPKSERSANFARLKINNDELSLIIKKSCRDEFDRNFYVAETILEKVKDLFLNLNETTVDDYDVLKQAIDLIKESLSKRPHRFVFLIMKLLYAEQSTYDEILSEYELKSLNNF